MSTVLWANHLLGTGEVVSDGNDKWALYKHAKKLDKLASAASAGLFSGLFDHTDLHFNLGDGELPDGMESTDELMARDGVWVTAADAVATLEGLLAVVNSEKPRFGLVRDDYEVVVSELSESIEYAKKAAELGAKFNFSVVM